MTAEWQSALVGSWSGQSLLWMQAGAEPAESTTSAVVTAVAGGQVLSIDYWWSHDGVAQDGRMLVASEDSGVHLAWCDSFHMGAALMDLRGPASDGVIAATGAYAVPDGEPWGWRIEIEARRAGRFELRMFNILPPAFGGGEALAVRSVYDRD